MGLYFALEWVHELGYDKAIFEMDTKYVMDSFNSICEGCSEFGALNLDCKSFFMSFFSNSLI